MNAELLAAIKARRKNMGEEEEVEKPKVTVQPQQKPEKKNTQSFSDTKKFLQANLFKQNLGAQQTDKPKKEEIKGNKQEMNKARALLQAKLNFKDTSSTGTGGTILPPPPSSNNFTTLPNLPPPPPPPPSLDSLPLPMNLPLPPSFDKLKLPQNLPPPPSLDLFNLQQNVSKPTTKTVQSPSINFPPPLKNLILPPPPTNLILPPPPKNLILTPSINTLNTNNMNTNTEQTTSKPIEKTLQKESIINVNIPKTQSILSDNEFRKYQTKIRQQKSIDKKKSVFQEQPFIRNTQISSSPSNTQTNAINKTQNNNNNIPNLVTNPQNSNQKNASIPNDNTNVIKIPNEITNIKTKPKSEQNPPNDKQNNKKKVPTSKQSSITENFFGKDVAGFLKMEFLKSNDLFSYIGKTVNIQPSKTPFVFPSIYKGTRPQNTNIQPRQTLYADTKTLNLTGQFMACNLDCVKAHNESRQRFAEKLKTYDLQKDPLKLNLKGIKQVAQKIPALSYQQPNIVKIQYNIKKCDSLMKQKAAKYQFEQCTQLKKIQQQMQKLKTCYCKQPQKYTNALQRIDELIQKISQFEST